MWLCLWAAQLQGAGRSQSSGVMPPPCPHISEDESSGGNQGGLDPQQGKKTSDVEAPTETYTLL